MSVNFQVVYFVNSGSEANDMAVMMARLHTKNQDVIVLKNCYHGGASSTISLTAQNTWKFPLPSYNIHAVSCRTCREDVLDICSAPVISF